MKAYHWTLSIKGWALLRSALLNEIRVFNSDEARLGWEASPRSWHWVLSTSCCTCWWNLFSFRRRSHVLAPAACLLGSVFRPGSLRTLRLLLESLDAVLKRFLLARPGVVAVCYSISGFTAVLLYVQHAELLACKMGVDLVEVGHNNQVVGHLQQDQVWRVQQARNAKFSKAVEGLQEPIMRLETSFLRKHNRTWARWPAFFLHNLLGWSWNDWGMILLTVENLQYMKRHILAKNDHLLRVKAILYLC